MKVQMKVTAFHMVDNLASGLYESVGQRVMELIRNSLVATMPNPDGRWEPKRAKIEISLVPNHPLANRQTALVVLDHGRGLTDPDCDRYFHWLGTPSQHVNGSSTGASQKGIGRLVTLALNEKCLEPEDYEVRRENGYYLLSRTSKSGKVRFVPFIPKMADEDGVEIDRWIEPTATEMGMLKGIQGSFTALVIPTPIFKKHEEIYEAIKYHLPREQDKMFELWIGGKLMQPPPLEKDINVTSKDGRYRARLGVGTTASDGVWLCDDETGFRVASCQKLGRLLLPEPLWYPDLVGDIFAPGLLRHQNTARSTLAKEFTRKSNKEWSSFMMFLISQVAPAAKQLIERDAIRGNAAETLDELAEMFRERFGEPDEGGGPGDDGPGGRPDRERKPHVPGPPKPPKEGGTDDPPGGDGTKYRRHISIRVGDETYTLYRGQTLHPFIFAQVNPNNQKMIFVNVRGGYQALPETKASRREHCLVQVLMAIGQSKYANDPHQAMRFANEVRSQFLK